MNKTKALEERLERVRQDKFKVIRRVVDCLESKRSRQKCAACPNRFLCRRFQDVCL